MRSVEVRDGVVTTKPKRGTALVLDAEWVRGTAGVALEAADPDAAHLPLAAIAARAVATADGTSVAVTGTGLVAAEARRLLQAQGRLTDGEAPGAIVETTGRVDEVAAALERVATLGIVVLAGETLGEDQTLDVYPDIHVRGIRVRGIPGEPDLALADAGADADGGQALAPGDRLEAGSRFYVIRA